MHLQNRHMLFALGGAAGLALAAIALGILYFVVFPSSAPQKLALSSATATPAAVASSSSSADGTWSVASGSQAGYRVRETLAFVGAPSDAVGRTSSVHGTVTITGSPSAYTVSAASLTVDVNTLTSDRSMRDQRIHTMGLQSNQYPTATFVLATPIAVPAGTANGQVATVSATGALTIHGVTKTVTIPIQARLSGSQVQLAGSITFPFGEFGMTPPSIGGFVSVQDNAIMEFAINLARAA
ncbi:MAG TPA: YceI family protein [Candidatus Dormibacteraeota bacterium]|jgi:polyisoprenoid-binding protein YceI|nr:YceI family protein [Candidatus Dormibacteraeota bacterium]